MIVFTCQCGKRYQLPDRNAGRVVRCNQCERSLTVPAKSQEEPVIPDTPARESEPVHGAIPLEPVPLGLATEPQEKPTAKPAGTRPTKQIAPTAKSPSPAATGPTTTSGPAAQPGPPAQHDPFGTFASTDPFAAATADPHPFGTTASTESVPMASPAMPASGAFAAPPRSSVTTPGKSASPLLFLGLFVGSIAAGIALGFLVAGVVVGIASPPPAVHSEWTAAGLDAPGSDSPAQDSTTATLGQVLTERDPQRFAVLSAGATEVRIAADRNPVAQRSGTDAVVDELEASLSDGPASREPHRASIRIEATGEDSFGITRVLGESGDCGLDQLAEVRFCLYMPETLNKAFEPKSLGDPPFPFALSDLSIRLGQGAEYVQLTPSEFAAFAAKYDRMQRGWVDLVVPIQGDETWMRMGSASAPETIQWIELQFTPGGKGVTLWIDNLKVVGK